VGVVTSAGIYQTSARRRSVSIRTPIERDKLRAALGEGFRINGRDLVAHLSELGSDRLFGDFAVNLDSGVFSFGIDAIG
jgi:hypothetical protein